MACSHETNSERVMFGVTTQLKATPKRVEKAADKGAYRSFFHAAASIAKSARESIEVSDVPSLPGQPVHTKRGRGGRLAKRSIRFSADRHGAVIGFSAERLDTAMQQHEHGGVRGGVRFPPRPTMAPALLRNLARFHREWQYSI